MGFQVRVGQLAESRASSVGLFGLFGLHSVAPRLHGRVGVGARLARTSRDSDEGLYAALGTRADAVVRCVVGVGEEHLRQHAGASLYVVEHWRHRAHVAADVGHSNADDRARSAQWGAGGGHLHIVAGAIPAVSHLHDARLGIGRRGARLVLALLAKLSDGDERLVDPTL